MDAAIHPTGMAVVPPPHTRSGLPCGWVCRIGSIGPFRLHTPKVLSPNPPPKKPPTKPNCQHGDATSTRGQLAMHTTHAGVWWWDSVCTTYAVRQLCCEYNGLNAIAIAITTIRQVPVLASLHRHGRELTRGVDWMGRNGTAVSQQSHSSWRAVNYFTRTHLHLGGCMQHHRLCANRPRHVGAFEPPKRCRS